MKIEARRHTQLNQICEEKKAMTPIQIRRIIKNLIKRRGNSLDTRYIMRVLEEIGISRASATSNIRWYRDYYVTNFKQRADLDIIVPYQRTLATYK